MANPDQQCLVCGVARDQHGDMSHEFSLDGVLRKKEAPEAPRQQAPRMRDETPQMPGGNISVATAVTMQQNLTMRLIQTLTAKGILTGSDLITILGGTNVAEHSPNE